MTINFNIDDVVGADYLLAVRWAIDRLDLNDNRIMNKYLKQKIASLIDDHKRYLAIGADLAQVQTSKDQATAKQLQAINAEFAYLEKKRLFELGFVSSDPGVD